MKRYLKNLAAAILLIAVAGFIASAGSHPQQAMASNTVAGSNHPVLPNGLDKHNAVVAWAQFQTATTQVPSLGARLASNTGEPMYDPAHYRVVGFGKASKNSTNTALDDKGNNVPATDTSRCSVGAQVLIVVNVQTNAEAEICTGCANPRIARIIHNIPSKPWHLETIRHFHQFVEKSFKKTCPSGQVVYGTLKAWVDGYIKAWANGEIAGKLKAAIHGQVVEKINATVVLKCAKMPTPKPKPQPTPTPPTKAPVKLGKVCESSNGSIEAFCPSGTFQFVIKADGLQYLVEFDPDASGVMTMPFGCTPGSAVIYTEQSTSGWTILNPASGTATVPCNAGTGAFASFKNQQNQPPQPPPPPPSGGGGGSCPCSPPPPKPKVFGGNSFVASTFNPSLYSARGV